MRPVEFDRVTAAAWNEACDLSPDAWLFHRHEWVTIEAANDQVGNRSFALADTGGRILGIQPLYVRENGLGAWVERALDCGLHRHTGLALAPGLDPAARHALRASAMDHVHRVASAEAVDRIHLNVQNLAPGNLGRDREEIPFWVAGHGYDLGLNFGPNGFVPVPGMATRCVDQIVPLAARSEEELFGALDEACRRAVRKAIRAGVTLAVGDGAGAVEAYYRLAVASSRRTGENLPPPSYYDAIDRALGASGRCRVLFAQYAGDPIAGLLILLDKTSAHFLAAASQPGALPLRPNDFLQWSAIAWLGRQGYEHYRLGPIFPDVPADWPIARVSRFKSKFGARGVAVIQGSRFLKPGRYRSRAPAAVTDRARGSSAGLDIVMRTYGVPRVAGLPAASVDEPRRDCPVIVLTDPGAAGRLGLCARRGPAGAWCHPVRRPLFGRTPRAYRALLPHLSFAGDGLEPVWVDGDGRPIVARAVLDGRCRLVVGLDVENEVVRYRQGDPERAHGPWARSRFGSETERANYLFDDQVVSGSSTRPWADHLGSMLAEAWSRLTGYPLLEPLPKGARGALALTGDDDQAQLETYAEQQRLVGGAPFTYFLHPLTRHDPETLASLGSSVEIGVHPDALARPDEYEALCRQQTVLVEKLCSRKIRVVRNHGYLSRGYLGHLPTWEDSGLELDVNHSAVEGTALTGSFLPMRVRRVDGTWSEHMTLLTAFGDGMIFALGLSERDAARRVRRLAAQVEATGPGVLAFNLHPQNVDRTRRLHAAALAVARRRGWVALGLESYLDWVRARDAVVVERDGTRLALTSEEPMRDLTIRIPGARGWTRLDLAPWAGRLELDLDAVASTDPGRAARGMPWSR